MNHDPKRPDDHPEAFLEARDPVDRSTLSGDGIENALDEIGAEITHRPRRAATSRWMLRRPITKPRAALLIGFATIGIGAAVAAGSQLSAHTGHFKPTVQEIAQVAKTNPEKAKLMNAEVGGGGPGEDLDPAGADFEEVYRQLSSDIPFPKGYESWRDSLIAEDVKVMKRDVEVKVTTGAIHGWFAMSAFCAWVLDWRHAEIGGDTQAAAQAAQVISEAPSWKAVKDEDPHPHPNALGDTSDYSLFGWMLPFRDAVLAGDSVQVEHLLLTQQEIGGRCWDYDLDFNQYMARHGSRSGPPIEKLYARYLASRTS